MKVERKKGIEKVRIHHNKNLFIAIIVLFVLLIVVLILFFKFSSLESEMNIKNNTLNNSQLANPASVYCIEHNGSLEIRSNDDGSQLGVCVLNETTECEEWTYFRGECSYSSFDSSNLCIVDGDCVPASCCHSTSCVNKINAPNCTGMYCTMDCKPGTLDCGQGSCSCINGKCEAVLG